MIDWFWYWIGVFSGALVPFFVLWLYNKIGIINFEMRISEGKLFKKPFKRE